MKDIILKQVANKASLPSARHNKDALFQVKAEGGALFRSDGDFWVQQTVGAASKDAVPVSATTDKLNGTVKVLSVGNQKVSLAQYAGYSGKTALGAMALASSRRVDLVMLGDSNQGFNGYGFTQGLEFALSQRFGCYATGIVPTKAVGAYGKNVSSADAPSLSASPTLPAGKASSVFYSLGGCSITPGYVASGSFTGGIGGISLNSPTPVGINNALKLWGAQWQDPSFSGGSFVLFSRLGVAPYTTLAKSSGISTGNNYGSIRIDSLNIPSGSGRAAIDFRAYEPGGTPAVGPFEMLYMRVENPALSAGFSTHTLYSFGGHGAWDFAWSMQNTYEDTLTTYFSEVRRLQIAAGQSPIVVVYMNTGLNDRNRTCTPSLGPNPVAFTGMSAAEYVDNIRGAQRRIRKIWEINEWPQGELYWLIIPSHRIADPDDIKLVEYRTAIAAATAADENTSVVDLGALMTQAQGNSGGWFAAGQSYLHLSDIGYDAIATLVVNQIP